MSETPPEETSTVDPDEAAEAAQAALETDSLGRPVLPTNEAHQKAMEQGYYGFDAKDLGAAQHPEDVRSFQEHADAGVDQPAHSEPVVVESPQNPAPEHYTGLNAPNTPAPVEGDATSADAPARTDAPAGAGVVAGAEGTEV